MGKIIGKITAALSAVTIAVTALPFAAQAETEQLPSGAAFDEIGAKIEKLAKENDYASFEAAVFCGDETIYTGCFGEIDIENHIAADEESVYDWGSITKTLTWVSALQLCEQGKLDLNEDVRTYLPDGFIRHAKYDDPITMLDLMNHTGGWCESTYDLFVTDEAKLTDLGTMLQNMEPAQVNRPGEISSYSNYGAGLAGYVVECVSGESYIDYVRSHIFEPLGMEHTSIAPNFRDNEWVRSQREKLKTYTADDNGNVVEGANALSYITAYPSGSAAGTIGDMVKYGQALVDESAPLFEKPETQAMIFEGSAFYTGTDIPMCCYGFWADPHKVRTYNHDGGTLACISNFVFDPVSNVGVAFMSNTSSAAEFEADIINLVFGKAEASDIAAGEITQRTDISGIYYTARSNLKGVMKLYGSTNIIPVSKTGEDTFSVMGMGEIERIGNDLYLFHLGDTDMLASGKTLDDGRYVIQMGGADMIRDSAAIPKAAIAAVYILSMVVCVLLLIIKLILTLIKKRKRYTGSGVITLAQVSKPAVLAMLLAVTANYFSMGGITKTIGIAFAGVNVLCAAICLWAVVNNIRAITSSAPEKAKAIKYVFNTIVNALFVFAVIFLETYQFWGC